MMKKAWGQLPFLIFTFFFVVGAAASTAAQSQVLVDTSPKTPAIGERWTLSLLIDHGVPDEVTVSAPLVREDNDNGADSLFPDSFTKLPRRSGGKAQTAVEYRFIPNAAGTYYIEPFTVTTPVGITRTDPIILEVPDSSSGSAAAALPTRLVKTAWQNAPTQMTVGEIAVFTLRVSALPQLLPQGQLPPQLFMPEVPPGVILASLPISVNEREGGIVLKLNLVPLTDNLRLGARTIQYENLSFEIPTLNVSVKGAQQFLNSGSTHIESSDEAPTEDADALDSVPGDSQPVSAQSLAELRRNERDHINGKQFVSVRRAAETSLGIFNTKDESRWRHNLLLGLSFFIIFLVIVTPFACLMIVRNTFRRRLAFFCAVVFAVLSSIYFYRFVDTSSVFKGTDGRFAVTLEATVRRTADIDGEELFSLKEGQPVDVLLKSDSWLYVRTNDTAELTGWIPAQEAIYY